MSDYLDIRPDGDFFLSHSHALPVTGYQFVAVCRCYLMALGVQPQEFGTHSFHIGAATKAFGVGLSNAVIQQIGHWR